MIDVIDMTDTNIPRRRRAKAKSNSSALKKLAITLVGLAVAMAIALPQLQNMWSNSQDIAVSDVKCSDLDSEYSKILCNLKVRKASSENSLPKYDRTKFGKPWADVDRNGCDTRNDILRRDLEAVVHEGCKIVSGNLHDPYTDKVINFKRGKSSAEVQIDHVVALQNAWVSGAYKWTNNRRLFFANDPLNLLAVDGPANTEKGSKDISQWVPSNKKSICSYAKRQIKIKDKYKLSVTEAEKSKFLEILKSCE